MRSGLETLALACLLTLLSAELASAQPLTERTPNLAGTWVSSPRALHFQFAHRFQTTGENADISDLFGDARIVNYPTFELSYGLFSGAMASVRYSSNSVIADNFNEWQLGLKYAPLREVGNGKIRLSVLAAWNVTNESFDGELAAETTLGPVLFSTALRGFSSMLALEDSVSAGAMALAGGLGVKLNRYVTLAGDVSGVVAGSAAVRDRTELGWGAGIHFGIPFTPHTFSIMATNVTSGTLQGVSTGIKGQLFWGFEFTVPFSGFARWGKIFKPDELKETPPTTAAGERPVVEVEIQSIAFREETLEIPVGTTVRWVNKDPVAHTSTSDDGVWESPLIGPGETFEFTFDTPGEFTYHCVPHPFMKARVVVTD